MNVSDLLNPLTSANTTTTSTPLPNSTNNRSNRSRCISTPIFALPSSSHQSNRYYNQQPQQTQDDNNITNNKNSGNIGKPRSRFSEYEDTIICNGHEQGLTWGQISDLLPHRKRATCFNRYRTLKGIRKSGKQSDTPIMTSSLSSSISSSPLSPIVSSFGGPTTPPPPCSPLPPVVAWSSADIIYPLNKSAFSNNKNNNNYVTDIINSSSSDSSCSSDDEDQFLSVPLPKRTHRISLPALTHSYRTFQQQQQPYYNL